MMVVSNDNPSYGADLSGSAPWEMDKAATSTRWGTAIWELQNGAENVPPLLILHSEADTRVPIAQAKGFHRGCLEHGITCTIVTYHKGDHLPRERSEAVDMLKRVKKLVNETLGG